MRLRSRHPFEPAVQNLLDDLARLGICASKGQITNKKHSTVTMLPSLCFCAWDWCQACWDGLPRAAWVKLNCLQIDAGQFHSSMNKWHLTPFIELRVWHL